MQIYFDILLFSAHAHGTANPQATEDNTHRLFNVPTCERIELKINDMR